MSILLYGCTTWTLTKRTEKKLGGNYTRRLWAVLNKSWRQHPTKQHRTPITKTIKVRQTRLARPCWRNKEELISDILLWTHSYRRAKVGRPARTYIQQLYADRGESLEYLPRVMDDRDGWRERVSEIRSSSSSWWWWNWFGWILWHINNCILFKTKSSLYL